jgi:tryptophanase
MDYVVEAILEVHERRHALQGLEIVEQPQYLRHFSCRFRPIGTEERARGDAGGS